MEFPDIRKEVNDGNLDAASIIEIRGNATQFRTWLQSESVKDRDAIIYYHQEVAKRSGLVRGLGSTLKLVSVAITAAPAAYPVLTRICRPSRWLLLQEAPS